MSENVLERNLGVLENAVLWPGGAFPLPIRLALNPWEDLASLISRLAKEMGYTSIDWILNPEEVPHQVHTYSLLSMRAAADYQFFENLLRIDEQTLYQHTFHRFAPRIQKTAPSAPASPGDIHEQLLDRGATENWFSSFRSTRVCPQCIGEEAAYSRLYWGVRPVVSCLKHRIILIDRCPTCSRSIPALRLHADRCPFCKTGNYRTARRKPLPEDPLFLIGQTMVMDFLGIEELESEATSKYESPLRTLLPWQYFRLLEAFRQTLAPFFPDSPFLQAPPSLRAQLPTHAPRPRAKFSLEEWSVFISTFHALFANFPHSFFSFLDELARLRSLRASSKTGVEHHFGAFYLSWLYKHLSDPAFSFLRDGFQEYLRTRYTGGNIGRLLTPFKENHSKPLVNTVYLSKKDAAIALGISTNATANLLEKGLLKTQKRVIQVKGEKRTKTTLYLIESESVEALLQGWKTFVTIKDVARSYLGISEQVMVQLEETGLLVPAHGPMTEKFITPVYKIGDVERFVDSLQKCATKAVPPVFGDITLCNAHRYFGEWTLVDTLKAVLDGRLHPIDPGGDQPVLRRLTLSQEETRRLGREYSLLRRRDLGLYTLDEAAASLGISLGAMRCWLREGILEGEYVRVKGAVRERLLIRQETLDEFYRAHVSRQDAAAALGINLRGIGKLVSAKTLHPIRVHNYQVLLKREEIQRLIPADSLSVAEAARVLGAPPQCVTVLIQSGRLTAVRATNEPGVPFRVLWRDLLTYQHDRVLFYQRLLEKLHAEWGEDENALLTRTEVANLLEVDRKTIWSQRALPIAKKQKYHGNLISYFREQDLEAFIQGLLRQVVQQIEQGSVLYSSIKTN